MNQRTLTASMVIAGVLFLSATGTVPARAGTASGRIVDSETGKPVPGATVRWAGSGAGVISADDGGFVLPADTPPGDRELIVRHIAYRPWRRALSPGESISTIRLTPVLLPGQDIVVTTSRAKRGESPVAFDNITKEELREAYHVQDIPMLLTESPGVYASSDDGLGIGYSYLSIRGFGQRRVSVLINGVPLNDPESHEVYWIDLPDLPESIEDAQIQRGVGTTLYGSNSIGGTINLRTNAQSPVRDITVSSGAGSYATRKFMVSANSGMIDDHYALSGRFSRVVSDGYRENSWTDLWAYYFSVSRFDEKWTTHANIFGGPEQTHLAYKGIPREFINGERSYEFNGRTPTGNTDTDRRYNPFEWNNETDNFNQPQYQLISEYRPDTNWVIENTLFYIKGKGFYDQLRTNRDFPEYHLTGFTRIVADGDSVITVNVDTADRLWRRRWVENDFWGIVTRATRRHKNGVLTFGGEFQRHHADHWAEVQSVSPAPPDFVPGQRYYQHEARKIVTSGFAQEVFRLTPKVTLTGALQYAFKEYRLFNMRFANAFGQRVKHATRYHFLSPRFGVTVRPHRNLTVFGSISYNEQEPQNDEVFDGKDYWTNARDFFVTYDSVSGIGSDPVMKPERLVDFELGASIAGERWRLDANLFRMVFRDEIVWNGQLNDDGVPIRINAASSVHQGVEIAGEITLRGGFTVRGNVSVNDNTFDRFIEETFNWDTWEGRAVDRSGNFIAGFPQHMANLRVTLDRRAYSVSAHVFRAGRLYIDNSQSPDVAIDPYTVLNVRGELKLEAFTGWTGLRAFIHVNNVLDAEYETGGYVDGPPLFLPAAKRTFYTGLRANL